MRGVFAGLISLLAVAGFSRNAIAEEIEGDAPRVALVGFDALGMDQERVMRLEILFLKELERLTGKPVPTRRQMARLPAWLQRCDGGNGCLGAIGKALQVDLVVSGNVAALGDSYVLNIKAIASADASELRRVDSDPLRGQPDELIEAIRVAAYRLLAPGDLQGAISVLADREGAIVVLDGKVVGKTPLAAPLAGLSLGVHDLEVKAGDYGTFSSQVQVRFQKTTRVVVNLVDLRVKAAPPRGEEAPVIAVTDAPKAWYQKRWFLITTGIGAAVLGGYAGYRLARQDVIVCSEDPQKCMP